MNDFECDIEYWNHEGLQRTVNSIYDSVELRDLIGEHNPSYFISIWFV